MKKLTYLFFLFPLLSFAQPNAAFYTGAITYDTTNHSCCVEFLDSSSSTVSLGSWLYYFGDGTAPVTVPDYTHCFSDTGVYEVCLTIQDINGAADTCCCNLNFLDPDSAFLDCSLTGIFMTSLKNVQFSPNPAKGSFTISGITKEQFEVRILDPQGKIVYDEKFSEGSALCKIENFLPGIYLVLINTNDGKFLSKEIIIH